MGFWQHLAESYDTNEEALKKNYPLSTTSISNNGDNIIIIVIDGDGNFLQIDKIEKANHKKKIDTEFVTMPVTEKSLGRSSGVSPHPVFDQYGYLKGNGNKYDAYLLQLKDFSESEFSTEQIKSIYQYVSKGTIESDIQNHDNKLDEQEKALKSQDKKLSKDEKGKLKALQRNKIKPKDKTNIIFRVEIPGYPQTKVWKDRDFFNAWNQYYGAEKGKLSESKKRAENELAAKKKFSAEEKKKFTEDAKLGERVTLDYVTGIKQLTATSHPKKISNASGNAKLISEPSDEHFYTFRGKFSDSSEAVSIGYETSQKAHQFLRYLISDRGVGCGEQVILSYTIGSMKKLLPPPVEEKSIWESICGSPANTESDIQIALRAETGFDYADALRKSIAGFGHSQGLTQHAKTAVISLDAATTGRLSVIFYRELDRNEYLERVADWHDGCKWNQQFWDKVDEKYVPYIGAPSVDKIIEAVYGKPRGGKDESYTKIKKAARERLVRCIFDGAFLPTDYVVAAVRRASNPLGITANGKFDRNGFERILATACALVRKDFQQRNKEGHKLNIELDRTDRDYLYGRLLGAADKLEEYALYRKDKDRVVTAAIRHMQTFAQRPFRTWQTIHGCLNPYIQTVKGGFAFNEIQSVMNQFVPGDYEKDTPLSGSYLIGYYHERAYIEGLVKDAAKKKKHLTDNNEEEGNNDGQ